MKVAEVNLVDNIIRYGENYSFSKVASVRKLALFNLRIDNINKNFLAIIY